MVDLKYAVYESVVSPSKKSNELPNLAYSTRNKQVVNYETLTEWQKKRFSQEALATNGLTQFSDLSITHLQFIGLVVTTPKDRTLRVPGECFIELMGNDIIFYPDPSYTPERPVYCVIKLLDPFMGEHAYYKMRHIFIHNAPLHRLIKHCTIQFASQMYGMYYPSIYSVDMLIKYDQFKKYEKPDLKKMAEARDKLIRTSNFIRGTEL
jgi:hypothetical protein